MPCEGGAHLHVLGGEGGVPGGEVGRAAGELSRRWRRSAHVPKRATLLLLRSLRAARTCRVAPAMAASLSCNSGAKVAQASPSVSDASATSCGRTAAPSAAGASAARKRPRRLATTVPGATPGAPPRQPGSPGCGRGASGPWLAGGLAGRCLTGADSGKLVQWSSLLVGGSRHHAVSCARCADLCAVRCHACSPTSWCRPCRLCRAPARAVCVRCPRRPGCDRPCPWGRRRRGHGPSRQT
jgi:hypothetical protein